MEGAGETKALLDRFEAVSARFGEDLDADEMEKLIAEQGELQEKIDAGDAWDLDRTVEIAMDALRCPPGDADVEQAVGRRAPPRGALPAAAAASPTCCCSTSRPTISTPNPWPGWSASCTTIPAPSSPSPTTATSSTMSRAGSSSSTAATASPGRATTPPGSKQKEKRLELEEKTAERPPAHPGARAGMDRPERRARARPRARRASPPTSSWSAEEQAGDADAGADRHSGRARAWATS